MCGGNCVCEGLISGQGLQLKCPSAQLGPVLALSPPFPAPLGSIYVPTTSPYRTVTVIIRCPSPRTPSQLATVSRIIPPLCE